jgi:asparagine synthase (glutamine-hydrolysing)
VSGIVGMIGRDGAPVDRPLLRSLTHYLSFRGPDAREVWVDGQVGFGHTLLRTTHESLAERQPASLDGQFLITADARIDCRAELLAALTTAGRKVRQSAPDSELILHAYAAWGEASVEHLRGDFAFAIWDARRKALFCARDHFGVKPFYYAELGGMFIFSNTLDCLRLHPKVSNELNDSAIADFLLFGLNCDETTTAFRDIRRLPPAHALSVSAEGIRRERYWSAPTDGRIRYHRPHEYVEHFQTLMQSAVSDRLRTTCAGVWLSGGMDSCSIAATARQLAVKTGGTADLRAYTIVYDSLIPDREGEHAHEAAKFLGISLRSFVMDGYQLFDRWEDPECVFPEPMEDPFAVALFDQYRAVAADCRVMLSGSGGDELMYFQMWPYTRDLLRHRHWRRLFTDLPQFLRLRKFPFRGTRTRMQRLLGLDSSVGPFPSWIAPELKQRFGLKERWNEPASRNRASEHPIVPKAHASLLTPRWPVLFELADPGLTRAAVEVRYPFLDLRVVNYLLAIPPFPWTFQKQLLRAAMFGHLPESIRLRPKTPLQGNPLKEILQSSHAAVDRACWTEQIERYINPRALPSLTEQKDSVCADLAVRAYCLNFWLQSLSRVRYNSYAEASNG